MDVVLIPMIGGNRPGHLEGLGLQNIEVYGGNPEALDVTLALFLLVKMDPDDPERPEIEITVRDGNGMALTYVPSPGEVPRKIIERIRMPKRTLQHDIVMQHLAMRVLLPAGDYTIYASVGDVTRWTWPIRLTYKGNGPAPSGPVRYGGFGTDRPNR